MAVIILQNRLVFRRVEYVATASIVVFLLFIPLAIIVKQEFRHWSSRTSRIEPPPPPPRNREIERDFRSCFGNAFSPPERGEDYTILQALFSTDMAILFVAASCGIGGTLTAIDNLGQIAKSLGYDPNTVTTFVSLVSIWNYLGRVAAGFVSEILLNKYKFPRPLMLAAVLLLSCGGHLLIAFPSANSLYAASVIIGFCFGAQWPLLFAIISEIFGLKYYSTLFQFGAVSSPVGAYVLNVRVAGNLYDREAMKQMAGKGMVRREGEGLNCFGRECYRVSFIIITAATLFGCLVSLILVVRTWAFYKGDIYCKFREDGETAATSTHTGNTI